ncbi:MAG: hypothetical protein COA94_03130 [Rickettsiales bacterium]|nr:MAG: hypothetical protein COA94_03130 [Rickettsiales bacterium]
MASDPPASDPTRVDPLDQDGTLKVDLCDGLEFRLEFESADDIPKVVATPPEKPVFQTRHEATGGLDLLEIPFDSPEIYLDLSADASAGDAMEEEFRASLGRADSLFGSLRDAIGDYDIEEDEPPLVMNGEKPTCEVLELPHPSPELNDETIALDMLKMAQSMQERFERIRLTLTEDIFNSREGEREDACRLSRLEAEIKFSAAEETMRHDSEMRFRNMWDIIDGIIDDSLEEEREYSARLSRLEKDIKSSTAQEIMRDNAQVASEYAEPFVQRHETWEDWSSEEDTPALSTIEERDELPKFQPLSDEPTFSDDELETIEFSSSAPSSINVAYEEERSNYERELNASDFVLPLDEEIQTPEKVIQHTIGSDSKYTNPFTQGIHDSDYDGDSEYFKEEYTPDLEQPDPLDLLEDELVEPNNPSPAVEELIIIEEEPEILAYSPPSALVDLTHHAPHNEPVDYKMDLNVPDFILQPDEKTKIAASNNDLPANTEQLFQEAEDDISIFSLIDEVILPESDIIGEISQDKPTEVKPSITPSQTASINDAPLAKKAATDEVVVNNIQKVSEDAKTKPKIPMEQEINLGTKQEEAEERNAYNTWLIQKETEHMVSAIGLMRRFIMPRFNTKCRVKSTLLKIPPLSAE